jgi:hypothetical protein
VPFRWELRCAPNLGGLLSDVPPPDLWYWNALAATAIKVVARSGGGHVYFVGRSLDSVYDFLTGALAGTFMADRLARLPISCKSPTGLTAAQTRRFREILGGCGITPRGQLSGRSPVSFCDTVDTGLTFTNLFDGIRSWAWEEGRWPVVRRKVRFLGVVRRNYPSPDVIRWHEQLPWPRQLPRSGYASVALDEPVWEHLTNRQAKITRSYGPAVWWAPLPGPPRRRSALLALAEADALFRYGAMPDMRRVLARLLAGEREMREPWLRRLVHELSTTAGR